MPPRRAQPVAPDGGRPNEPARARSPIPSCCTVTSDLRRSAVSSLCSDIGSYRALSFCPCPFVLMVIQNCSTFSHVPNGCDAGSRGQPLLSPADGPLARADGLFAEQDKWLWTATRMWTAFLPSSTSLANVFPACQSESAWRSAVNSCRPQRSLLTPLFPFVWRKLNDPSLHRPHGVTCWRILHACLGCNAFLCYARGGLSAARRLALGLTGQRR